MRAFRDGEGHGDILVPTTVDYDRYVQDIIDAVTLLAKIENRYAGDVLNDLLSPPGTSAAAAPALPTTKDRGDSLTQPVNR